MKKNKEKQAHSLWAVYRSGKLKEEAFWAKYEALLSGTEHKQTKVVAPSSPTVVHKKRTPTNLHLTNVVLKPESIHYVIPVVKMLVLIFAFFKISSWLFYSESGIDSSGVLFSWVFLMVIWVALTLRLTQSFHMVELTSKGVFIKNALFKFKVVFVTWDLLESIEVIEQKGVMLPDKQTLVIDDNISSYKFNYYLSQTDHHELAYLVRQHQVTFKYTSSKYYPV